jgi:hypothetical protein
MQCEQKQLDYSKTITLKFTYLKSKNQLNCKRKFVHYSEFRIRWRYDGHKDSETEGRS